MYLKQTILTLMYRVYLLYVKFVSSNEVVRQPLFVIPSQRILPLGVISYHPLPHLCCNVAWPRKTFRLLTQIVPKDHEAFQFETSVATGVATKLAVPWLSSW